MSPISGLPITPVAAATSGSAELVERGHGDGLHAGGERGVDDRREPGVVVGRDVVGHAARLLGATVLLRIGAADVPEHRWHLPLGAEGPEVLAGRHGSGELVDAIASE